jgi:hypothetical protein
MMPGGPELETEVCNVGTWAVCEAERGEAIEERGARTVMCGKMPVLATPVVVVV